MGLLEDIMREKKQNKIFDVQIFGGLHCKKMRRSIFSPATYVKE
jgi:hypothetical protein